VSGHLTMLIEMGSVWRDVAVPNRRIRITEVSAISVTFDVTYSTEPDAWDHAANSRTELKKVFAHRFAPEVAS
jgi:hypothetical protein